MRIFKIKSLSGKKKVLSLVLVWFLSLSIPISIYFLTQEQDFDRRAEAAVFNSLVDEYEAELANLEPNSEYVPGVLRLEFPEGVSNEEIEKIIGGKRNTPEELKDTPFERVEYIEVDASNIAWEMAKFDRYTSAESVDLNYLFEPTWREDGSNRMLPNDWSPANHWYFNKIKLPEVWKLQGCSIVGSEKCGGSKDVIVAIIDTGLAFNAPEVQGMNIFSHPTYNRNQHMDRHGHGTYVAGIIASTTNNSIGSVGLAHNVTIMPYRVGDGLFEVARTEQALYYASQYGADVINMSFGMPRCRPYPSFVLRAVDYAYNSGVVLVGASGNAGISCVSFLAASAQVIAVGSVNADNSRATYSQYGSNLDFVAPVGSGSSAGNATWQQSYSCYPHCSGPSNNFSNKYVVGTSFAAPQVAGAAALILSINPSLTPKQVKDVLIATVDDIRPTGKDTHTGYGVLNLENIYNHLTLRLVFSASPATMKYGGETTLTWSISGASHCEASDGWSGRKGISGSEKISPLKTTKYTLTCFKENERVTESITVDVEEMKLSLTANPQLINSGDKSILKWEASGVSTCEASGGWAGERPLSGQAEVSPLQRAVYRLTCYQHDRRVIQSVQVRVKDCEVTQDCRREEPKQICFQNSCLNGDINDNGIIDIGDFILFRQDFIKHRVNGWSSDLRRSDFNTDFRLSMADYSIFVSSYRFFRGFN